MKKIKSLGSVLTKIEQKRIVGGDDYYGGDGGGGCVGCQCGSTGYHSCWYTTNPLNLCDRVYPNCTAWAITPYCYSGDTCHYN